ncbi:hypothetical protein GGS26DRAFT_248669 [Hypomontagnella submonticulosa]|nr:hypothetical protein GGS26DRAFT_248669 [Hypomontagnella submonticulosa]
MYTRCMYVRHYGKRGYVAECSKRACRSLSKIGQVPKKVTPTRSEARRYGSGGLFKGQVRGERKQGWQSDAHPNLSGYFVCTRACVYCTYIHIHTCMYVGYACGCNVCTCICTYAHVSSSRARSKSRIRRTLLIDPAGPPAQPAMRYNSANPCSIWQQTRAFVYPDPPRPRLTSPPAQRVGGVGKRGRVASFGSGLQDPTAW